MPLNFMADRADHVQTKQSGSGQIDSIRKKRHRNEEETERKTVRTVKDFVLKLGRHQLRLGLPYHAISWPHSKSN
jgi:hypothetical protein